MSDITMECCPPSAWNGVRDDGGTLSGISVESCPPSRGIRSYTLIAPQTGGGKVYLIDIHGQVVHEWQLPVRPGRHAVILPNGNLGYNGNHAHSPERYAPWSMWHGGDFYEVTPQGEVVWHYEDTAHHHDAQWLPNGHLLYAACESAPIGFVERVPGGTSYADDPHMQVDVIREVDRQGRLVWEWKAWEHLDPANFPIHPGFGRYHWPLVNGLDVTPEGDVLMSLRVTSGVIRVDRASGQVVEHFGRAMVSHQHAPVVLENGNVLVFDNGNFREGQHVAYSRVLEIESVTQQIVWSYADPMVSMFYTPYMGSAQRLPNGNTHITESATGRLFEVNPVGEVVWEYIVPWFASYPDEAARKTGPGLLNTVFRTYRYSREQLPWLKT